MNPDVCWNMVSSIVYGGGGNGGNSGIRIIV
jgi:hypothetical protein